MLCGTVNLGAAVKCRTARAFERWTSRQLPGSHPLLTHFKLESKHYFILSVLQYWTFDDGSEFYHMRGKITECRFAETESIFFLITWALLVIKRAWLLDTDLRQGFIDCNVTEWSHACNIDNCILWIKCWLNLFKSYVFFDICGGIERASSRWHRSQMQFPQIFWRSEVPQESEQLL